jgi:hypothetical protein
MVELDKNIFIINVEKINNGFLVEATPFKTYVAPQQSETDDFHASCTAIAKEVVNNIQDNVCSELYRHLDFSKRVKFTITVVAEGDKLTPHLPTT